jgi:Lon protease-like protein
MVPGRPGGGRAGSARARRARTPDTRVPDTRVLGGLHPPVRWRPGPLTGAMGVSRYLPIFPLGNPVLPTQILPLHVFEDRYRVLMETITGFGSSAEIGVVLIERGSEVGGGDVRVTTGTVAHLIESERLADGRWVAIFAGSHPFVVERWLEDDPYPQAVVAERADEVWAPAEQVLLDAAQEAVRHAVGLAGQLGEPVGSPQFQLSGEPSIAAWELCARAPLGALDRQRLLESASRAERLALLARLAVDAATLLAFRLRGREGSTGCDTTRRSGHPRLGGRRPGRGHPR